MHLPMIQKESSASVGYSVVDLNGVRHLFASAVPCEAGDLQQQAHDALRNIETVTREQGLLGSIVHQAVFMRDIQQVEACRQIMRDFYGNELPATSYIPQAPCGDKLLEIEVMGVDQRHEGVEIRRLSERTVTTRHNGITWGHCANLVPETPAETVYDRSLDAFRRMDRELAASGFRYDQVVRTWLYLGDIVGPENQVTRYQQLNLARTDFYQNLRFIGDRFQDGPSRVCYPASTCIGANGRDVMMGCLALATDRPDVVRLPLENPRQIAAHDYDHRYGPQTPKFSRAMAIICDGAATVLVSGTASILDSETHHIGNVVGQTQETLDNIAALISEDNFRRHGQTGLGATLDDMALMRVYVKRQEDFAAVRNVCKARLGELPVIYAVADVCRPDLLVEIEGIAFCSRT
jgi:enamine deaminase RidA (YjgF/YER057c/UK114 family)